MQNSCIAAACHVLIAAGQAKEYMYHQVCCKECAGGSCIIMGMLSILGLQDMCPCSAPNLVLSARLVRSHRSVYSSNSESTWVCIYLSTDLHFTFHIYACITRPS